eukprot:m.296409 g.296409  ORF g.296409 m.296409 type:complete len:509 (+) comp20060_c0_seq7:309-1835(+)
MVDTTTKMNPVPPPHRMSTSTTFARAIEVNTQLRRLKRDHSECDVKEAIAVLADSVNSGKLPFFFVELAIRIVFDKRNGPLPPIIVVDGENNIIQRVLSQVRSEKRIDPVDYCPADLRTSVWDGIMSEGSRLRPQGTRTERQTAELFSRYVDVQAKPAVPQWKLDMQNAKKHPKPVVRVLTSSQCAPCGSCNPSAPPCHPRAIPLADIPWEKIVSMTEIAGGLGSSGVFVVSFDGGGAVVLKPGSSSNLCAELFGTLCMQHFGLPAPNCVVPHQAELKAIMRNVLTQDNIDEDSKESSRLLKLRYNKGKRMLLVMEYVHGTYVQAASKSENWADLLFQLGRIATVDAVINNFDRIPAVHKNTGNIKNWLIDHDTKAIVIPIDQATSFITVEAGKKSYREQVKEFGNDARAANSGGACCVRLRQHFENAVGISLDDSECCRFLEGVRDMIEKISAEPDSIYVELKDKVVSQCSHLEQNLRLAEQLSAINPEFIASNAHALLGIDVDTKS